MSPNFAVTPMLAVVTFFFLKMPRNQLITEDMSGKMNDYDIVASTYNLVAALQASPFFGDLCKLRSLVTLM